MRNLHRLGMTLVATLSLGGAPVRAQDGSPIYAVSYIEVAPAIAKAAVPLLRALQAAAHNETGNSGFDVLQRIGQPGHFVLLEIWSDAKTESTHAAAGPSAQFRDKVTPALIAPIDKRTHVAFAAGPAKTAGRGAVYAVTHVDFIPTKKDEGLTALKRLAADSTKEPGSLRYDIWQQSGRPNHLTVIEVWRDKAALEAHEMAGPARKFRDALLPMSGALYDQRLYRSID